MIKPTKRKAFNFLRSYFDVLNELQNDKDRLSFLTSIINKQFLDENPKDLNFISNLCYESQRHQIESSVNGWKRVNKGTPLTNPPTNPPTTMPTNPKEEEEEDKEKEKEKGEGKEQLHKKKKQKFINWFNEEKKIKTGKKGTIKILSTTDDNNLKKLFKEYKMEDFKIAFDNMFKSSWAVENGMCNISHLIRVDNFNKYLGQGASEGTGKTFSAFNK